MQSAKETAANVAASAKSGMEKTKATVQEKGERMTTCDPVQKEMATDKKYLKINEAECQKLEERRQNAASKQAGGTLGRGAPYDYTTGAGAATGHPTGRVLAGEIRRADYPQRMGGEPGYTEGATGDVRPNDPNYPGRARTGYGSGNTF